jgi:twinkle protein
MSDYYDAACPKCQEQGRDSAEDNMRVFKDTGLGYCIVCDEVVGKDEEVKMLVKTKPKEEKKDSKFLEGEYCALPSRKISKATCEFYGYKVNKQKKVHIAGYYDKKGDLIMQQLRTTKKEFPIIGDKKGNDTLWGMHKFSPNDNLFITITEGQIDAMSIYEACGDYPVVSLPNGAGSAKNAISKNMKYLEGFKHVVLAFDSDEPGQKAIKDCISQFSPGKLKIAKWRLKDASEMLQAGAKEEIKKSLWRAIEYIPEPVLTGERLLNTLKGYFRKTLPWPWYTANQVIKPIYLPAIYTIAAWPEVGKTTIMASIMKYIIEKGNKIGVISLEESIPKMVLKISDKVLGTKLSRIENRDLTDEEIEQARPITESIVTYDHKEYGTSIETILENLPYIAQSLKCEFIIFDNLSFAASGTGDDERRHIDKAMRAVKTSSVKYEYTLFNVCHLNDDDDDFRQATIRGSRGVQMYSDQVIYIGRDTESQDPLERNKVIFYVKKDREFGTDTGKSFELLYNPETRDFNDSIDYVYED